MARLVADQHRGRWLRLIAVNGWLFLLIMLLGSAADLLTKEAVFTSLGIDREDIHHAVAADRADLAAATEAIRTDPGRDADGRAEALSALHSQPTRHLPPHYPPEITLINGRALDNGEPPPPFASAPNLSQPSGVHLSFRPVLNPGALGGLFGGQIEVLVGLSVLAVISMAWLLFRSTSVSLLHQLVGGLIMAGALGNIYDRLVFGCVRDFVDFWWPGVPLMEPWNTFNLADACIDVGIVGLLLLELIRVPLMRAKMRMAPPRRAAKAEGKASSDMEVQITGATYRSTSGDDAHAGAASSESSRSDTIRDRADAGVNNGVLSWVVVSGRLTAGSVEVGSRVRVPLRADGVSAAGGGDGGAQGAADRWGIARVSVIADGNGLRRHRRAEARGRPVKLKLCLAGPAPDPGTIAVGDARAIRGANGHAQPTNGHA